MVYDISGNLIGDMHWRDTSEVQEGDELELESGVLVQVEDYVERKDANLDGLLVDHSQRSNKTKSPMRASVGTGGSMPTQFMSSQPRSQGQSQVGTGRMKTLNELLGTKRPQIGRVAPQFMKSPYEQKHATMSSAAVSDRTPKVQMNDSKQKISQVRPSSTMRGNSRKGLEPTTATRRSRGLDKDDLCNSSASMKNHFQRFHPSKWTQDTTHETPSKRGNDLLCQISSSNGSISVEQPLQSGDKDASQEEFPQNAVSPTIMDLEDNRGNCTTDIEDTLGLSQWDMLAATSTAGDDPQTGREPPREEFLLYDANAPKASNAFPRFNQYEHQQKHSNFKRPIPTENLTEKLRLAREPPRKKFMLGSGMIEREGGPKKIDHDRTSTSDKINDSEKSKPERQRKRRLSGPWEEHSHDGAGFTQDETLFFDEDIFTEHSSTLRTGSMNSEPREAPLNVAPQRLFRQSPSPSSPAKKQANNNRLKLAPDKPRKKLIFQDLSNHVLEKNRSIPSSASEGTAGFSSASMVASDPKAFDLRRFNQPKTAKEPESPQKPTTTIHDFFKSQTSKTDRPQNDGSTHAEIVEEITKGNLHEREIKRPRLHCQDTRTTPTNPPQQNGINQTKTKPAPNIPTHATSRQTSLASFVGKRDSPIPEESDVDDDDDDNYHEINRTEEQGPWTRESMFLFDWWPPGREKPSLVRAEESTANPVPE